MPPEIRPRGCEVTEAWSGTMLRLNRIRHGSRSWSGRPWARRKRLCVESPGAQAYERESGPQVLFRDGCA